MRCRSKRVVGLQDCSPEEDVVPLVVKGGHLSPLEVGVLCK